MAASKKKDLFGDKAEAASNNYSAKDIQVLDMVWACRL